MVAEADLHLRAARARGAVLVPITGPQFMRSTVGTSLRHAAPRPVRKPPARSAGPAHFCTSSEPGLLGLPQFLSKRRDIADEAKQECEIYALVLRHIVDCHGTRFQKDGAEQARNRDAPTATADPDLLDLSPVQRLRATWYLHRMKLPTVSRERTVLRPSGAKTSIETPSRTNR